MQSAPGPQHSGPDRLVKEFDIYVGGIAGTKLDMLQYPLRPPWRPYELDDVKTVDVKPTSRKFRMCFPIEEDAHYNSDMPPDDKRRIQSITLNSTALEQQTTFAVGTKKGTEIVLTRLDAAYQMRPSMVHMNKDTNKGPAQPDAPPSGPVQVQIQKRETERQQQIRKSSYAYLKEQEAGEAWVPMDWYHPETEIAAKIWKLVMSKAATPGREHPAQPKDAYVREMVPIPDPSAAAPESQPSAGVSKESRVQGDGAAVLLQQVAPAQLAAIHASMRRLFTEHTVLRVRDVQRWIDEDQSLEAGKAVVSGSGQESLLHAVVMSCDPHVAHIAGHYVLRQTGDKKDDPFRAEVVQALVSRPEGVRKVDVLAAANAKDITVSDALYNRVMKSLCRSNPSGVWTLHPSIVSLE